MTGFLNINKEEGVSSAFVVNRIKRLTHTPSGHMGTLDPLASGVLPVAVGNAARLFDFFQEKKKTYLARFTFGATTRTLDREGEKILGGSVPSRSEIEGALPIFIGKISQVPPQYSAVSVNGVRSYNLARSGQEAELKPKTVEVFEFSLLKETAPAEFSFRIVCGSGTYIRALCRDLAAALQTSAYMSSLTRTASGIFTLEQAVTLSSLSEENIKEYLIPTQKVLPYPVLASSDMRIFNGVSVPVKEADGRYLLYKEGEFYGIARVENGRARAEKKLC